MGVMRRGFVLPVILIIILVIGALFILVWTRRSGTNINKDIESVTELPIKPQGNANSAPSDVDIPTVSIVATGLDTPWAIAFLPGGGLLVTERQGSVRLVDTNGHLQEKPVAEISNVREIGEGGLLGIALHPDFLTNNFVYFYYTYSESGGNTLNRVVRMVYKNGQLTEERIMVDGIPGAANHNGGRIKFGPDKMLYITTGDAQNPSSAQDKNSLSGKILRVDSDGNPAFGNPYGNRTYSFGHRNPQGIIWDKDGSLWETEHGPSGAETGNDEFNRIDIGKNYGWPEIRGKEGREGMVTPNLESGRSDTWAPSGLASLPTQTGLSSRFYFAGLRGEALYEVNVVGNSASLKTHFKGEYGRIREVILGPDNMLYISTSNRDGRGDPKPGDDKILRINPSKL
ncbi:hypothetical protein A2955_02000 [Candidatus Woesebacteria bacterium RIFCSPLOWO2_01_FULL_37_19]|uniref:Glucose/Sorbosone dehydrogenase domain-containing protein n=1 Tax=Candidatus Woesebacteria bacterium RIFCSPLOWO2_01_FULL_37_19 TaxID=1802514 RepID=A0A1F8AZG0_9BACT|nr:MAG: hypothetical protein A2955_02000 [Candidatus Woesebacteria bacterium RIFCSPLOWO2_01_FULL_37_19]